MNNPTGMVDPTGLYGCDWGNPIDCIVSYGGFGGSTSGVSWFGGPFVAGPFGGGGGNGICLAYCSGRNIVTPLSQAPGGASQINIAGPAYRVMSGGDSWLAGVGRNLNFLSNWFWETNGFPDAQRTQFHGKSFLFYGANTPETQDMMASPGISWINNTYAQQYGCSGSVQNLTFPTFPAYLLTAWNPGSTAFQVGAFSADLQDNGNGTLTYTMYNKAGWHSLFGGLNFGIGDHELQPAFPMHMMSQFGGNVRQMFQATIANPCN